MMAFVLVGNGCGNGRVDILAIRADINKNGVAPALAMTDADAMKLRGVTITSSSA